MTSGQTKGAAPAPPSSPPHTDAMDAFDGTEEVVKISGGIKRLLFIQHPGTNTVLFVPLQVIVAEMS